MALLLLLVFPMNGIIMDTDYLGYNEVVNEFDFDSFIHCIHSILVHALSLSTLLRDG